MEEKLVTTCHDVGWVDHMVDLFRKRLKYATDFKCEATITSRVEIEVVECEYVFKIKGYYSI